MRDNVPELTLDGSASEYSFADVKDAVAHIETVKSAFAGDRNDAVRNPQSARPGGSDSAGDISPSVLPDSELGRKVSEL